MINNSEAVKIHGVSKSFNKGKLTIFDKIDFSIQFGTSVGLIGENGSGKTTLIKMISNIIEPDEGNIYMCGHDIKTSSNMIRKKVSVLSDANRSLYWNLTGIENINYFCAIKNIGQGNKLISRIEELIESFQMGSYIGKKVNCYSRGMKQRLMILISLLGEPSLLLFDEPMSGLDFESIIILKDIIQELKIKYNSAVLITSHDKHFIDETCDEIWAISNKKIVLLTDRSNMNKKCNIYFYHECINSSSLISNFQYNVINGSKKIYHIVADINDEELMSMLLLDIRNKYIKILDVYNS